MKTLEFYNMFVGVDGCNTLRIDYNLTPDSTVFDVGGYEGGWAEKIYNTYKCNIYIFEPVLEFYQNIFLKFKDNEKVRVFNYGLSNKDARTDIYICGDSSSTHMHKGCPTPIDLRDIVGVVSELKLEYIDLMKLNIEGEEFTLIPHIIDSGIIKNIKDLQVQFHDDIYEDSEERMYGIHSNLEKTHEPTYIYKFVWENWRILE